MSVGLVWVFAAMATISLGGCAWSTPEKAAAAAQSNKHDLASTGFGLGPQDYKTNGGAFGPDQGDR